MTTKSKIFIALYFTLIAVAVVIVLLQRKPTPAETLKPVQQATLTQPSFEGDLSLYVQKYPFFNLKVPVGWTQRAVKDSIIFDEPDRPDLPQRTDVLIINNIVSE